MCASILALDCYGAKVSIFSQILIQAKKKGHSDNNNHPMMRRARGQFSSAGQKSFPLSCIRSSLMCAVHPSRSVGGGNKKPRELKRTGRKEKRRANQARRRSKKDLFMLLPWTWPDREERRGKNRCSIWLARKKRKRSLLMTWISRVQSISRAVVGKTWHMRWWFLL